MFSNSTLKHLRLPFSFFLMPVYWFALSIAPSVDITALVLSFISLHFFVYPASNGFNSYYDKDEKSIGGLENPPPVTPDLLFMSLFMDMAGIIIALLVSWQFALAIFVYGLASKAYSYDKIRLKKYPIISLLVVGFFQGGFIFVIVYQAVSKETWENSLQFPILFPAFLNTLMLIGSYPMTQIYQHEEDAKRGDLTMSRMLGIRGTFIYTSIVFGFAIGGLSYYFWQFGDGGWHFIVFQVMLLPVLLFFLRWLLKCFYNPEKADFKHTMRLNFLSALCLNACFILFFVMKHLK
jgi:1,4-dihydroxy-2-naphthoate octaprenyltransferase